jgi:HAD superfamily hydrolase (TIGR01490 family)
VGLAIFDLDNTLIGGDSDTLWGEFLSDHGYVDGETHRLKHQRYYEDYEAGRLDILEFLRFQLHVLTLHDPETLFGWREQYLQEKIEPILLPKARDLLRHHREQGHTLLIITATNRFITEPIARLYEVEHLIATEPEIVDGRYSGRVAGTPSYASGKVSRMEEWLERNGLDFKESWFYSDSHNDLPLLNKVTYPVAVDPDEVLATEARRMNWPIISLR